VVTAPLDPGDPSRDNAYFVHPALLFPFPCYKNAPLSLSPRGPPPPPSGDGWGGISSLPPFFQPRGRKELPSFLFPSFSTSPRFITLKLAATFFPLFDGRFFFFFFQLGKRIFYFPLLPSAYWGRRFFPPLRRKRLPFPELMGKPFYFRSRRALFFPPSFFL